MSLLGYVNNGLNQSLSGIVSITDGSGTTISEGSITTESMTATNIYGTISTQSQPNITSVGTLTSLNVSGTTNLKAVNTDSIVQSVNSTLSQSGLGRIVQNLTPGNLNVMGGISLNSGCAVYFSGNGSIDQTSTNGTNNLSNISMLSGNNINMSGNGTLIQSGGSVNALKATNFTGSIGINGSMTQISGSNTFLNSSIGDITQSSKSIIQTGTTANILKSTQISDLVVTNSLTIPSAITIPSATFNGDTSYVGTAKIIQSGSTGLNTFNGSTFDGDISTSGNILMTGGSLKTCTLNLPNITGLTTCSDITQVSGVSLLRSLTCNQLDINSGYNQNMTGSSIISQSGTSSNIFKTSGFSGACSFQNNITQTSGNTTLLDTTAGNLTLSALKRLKFSNDTVRKITLYDSTGTNGYNWYGMSVEGGVIRYNTEGSGTSHVFSHGNTTAFVENMRVNNTGLGIGTTPSYKLHVVGSSMLDGVNLFTTSLNSITPATFNFLANVSSDIQQQLNTNSSTGTGNSSAITALQTKTTNQSYSSGITTFSGTVNGITSSMVGLGNCDNTSDINKPISTLQQNGLNLKGTLAGVNNWTNTNTFTTDFFVSGTGTFPTTSTGGNQGLALYWNQSAAGGEVDYLSRGQSAAGGHRFFRSNNTTPATLLLDINHTGATFSNDVIVNGNFSCLGTVGNTVHTGTLTGVNEILSGTLNVSGIITGVNEILSGTLGVTGLITGVNEVLSGTLGVTGLISGVNETLSGTLNVAGVTTLNEVTATSLKTYDDPSLTYVTTFNNTGLAATITVGAYYGKQINISIPVSFKIAGGVTPPSTTNITGTLTSCSSSVLKNGSAFSTPLVTSNNGFGIVKTYVGNNNPYSAEQYFTNLNVSFTPTVQSTSATYTINFTIVGSTFYLNTTQSNYSSSAVIVQMPSGVGYSVSGYTESLYNIGGRTGHVEVTDLNISNNLLVGTNINTSSLTANSILSNSIVSNTSTILNGSTLVNSSLNALGVSKLSSLNFYGMAGAYIIDGSLSGISYPINSSIPNYNDFYSKSTSTSIVPSVGSICSATFNLNDKDDLYMIMAGYQLIIYDTIGYTGTITLNVNNTSQYPIWCNPSSINTGSSCRLYFNGIELI